MLFSLVTILFLFIWASWFFGSFSFSNLLVFLLFLFLGFFGFSLLFYYSHVILMSVAFVHGGDCALVLTDAYIIDSPLNGEYDDVDLSPIPVRESFSSYGSYLDAHRASDIDWINSAHIYFNNFLVDRGVPIPPDYVNFYNNYPWNSWFSSETQVFSSQDRLVVQHNMWNEIISILYSHNKF